MSIYVGNLAYSVSQEDLTQVFGEYGGVKSISLPTDRETGKMRGFAFVELDSASAEDAAIAALDGAEWMGRDLRVSKARPKENRPERSFGDNNRDSFSRSDSRRY
jgi:RNA recognition motif-containing protein